MPLWPGGQGGCRWLLPWGRSALRPACHSPASRGKPWPEICATHALGLLRHQYVHGRCGPILLVQLDCFWLLLFLAAQASVSWDEPCTLFPNLSAATDGSDDISRRNPGLQCDGLPV